MKSLRIIPIALCFSASVVLAQSENSVGVPPYHAEPPSEWHGFYGMGVNLGHVNDAPTATAIGMTYQKSPIFYGFDYISSAGSGPTYAQVTVTEVDLLIGYSWDQIIPSYHGPPMAIRYSIATGLSINSFTHIENQVVNDGYGFSFSYNTQQTDGSLGLPLQSSVIFEPFSHLGIGAKFFYTVSSLPPSYGGAVVLELRY